jgi:Suppressor of fused protein (SUFU)
VSLFRRRPKRSEPPDHAAPGWDAIDGAMKAVHGDVEPVHKGLVPGLALGSPLQGVSAYAAADHWHLVTYGLTELFAKQSELPEISGLGDELTMRVPRVEGSPPQWPYGLLAKVAQAAWEGHDFSVGHRLQVGGPITGEPGCAIEAVAFVSDPSLPTWTKSPNGSFEFYELVGITPAELAEMQASSTAAVVERLAETNPLLITDPSRT